LRSAANVGVVLDCDADALVADLETDGLTVVYG